MRVPWYVRLRGGIESQAQRERVCERNLEVLDVCGVWVLAKEVEGSMLHEHTHM